MDIEKSVDFYVSKLGFAKVFAEQGVYGIVGKSKIHLHFWACSDRKIAEATSCRVQVKASMLSMQAAAGTTLFTPTLR